jgi:hypothetical protein
MSLDLFDEGSVGECRVPCRHPRRFCRESCWAVGVFSAVKIGCRLGQRSMLVVVRVIRGMPEQRWSLSRCWSRMRKRMMVMRRARALALPRRSRTRSDVVCRASCLCCVVASWMSLTLSVPACLRILFDPSTHTATSYADTHRVPSLLEGLTCCEAATEAWRVYGVAWVNSGFLGRALPLSRLQDRLKYGGWQR